MHKIQLLDEAISDLRQSSAWYDEQQSGLGQRYLNEVFKPHTNKSTAVPCTFFRKVQVCKS